MASQFNTYLTRAITRASFPQPRIPQNKNSPFVTFIAEPRDPSYSSPSRAVKSWRIRVSDGRDSYLDMWKKAVDRDRRSIEFQRLADNSVGFPPEEAESPEVLERKTNEFQKILEIPPEERDRVQRMQVIDRAAAAIAAARALLQENVTPPKVDSGYSKSTEDMKSLNGIGNQQGGIENGSMFVSQPRGALENATPGPDFWSWTPPPDPNRDSEDERNMSSAGKSSLPPTPISPVMEKEQSVNFLSIPFETKLIDRKHSSYLPPLQSLMEAESIQAETSSLEKPHLEEERDLGLLFSSNAAEATRALSNANEISNRGVSPDGSRWWKETGTEQRSDGVICRWTLMRGVSADKAIEWEDKYWEAANAFGHKELGSEKSGRDAFGNVWHEYWKESMWQNEGILNFEKTADKWGKNAKGDQWQEKWWESYDASGQAEKWAHKWCSIDPNTPVDAGHAHIWHERWGEKYDGQGSSVKYTDKWAEHCDGDGWERWGDKWDEHFDVNGHGVKQGETWWQGKHGDRWNRTWGEGHNGSGWVHKYGKSSSGEHWDTHLQQETWYERFPHYGFHHCFENSVQLREVQNPSEWL